MSTDAREADADVPIEIMWVSATVCGILFPVVCALIVLASSGPEVRVDLEGPIEKVAYAVAITCQLFAPGLMVSCVLAVADPVRRKLVPSSDAGIYAGLVGVLVVLGYASNLPDQITTVVFGFALAFSAVLMALIRLRAQWRWRNPSAGHLLAAGALLVYGVTFSIVLRASLAVHLAVGVTFFYCACYALGLVTLRADEFRAACQPDAPARTRPSVNLTASQLSLAVISTAGLIWLHVQG